MIGTPNAGVASAKSDTLAELFAPGGKYLGQKDLWKFNQLYGDPNDQLGVPFYFVSGAGGPSSSDRGMKYVTSRKEPEPNDGIVARQSVVDCTVSDPSGSSDNADFRNSNDCKPENETLNCLIRIPPAQSIDGESLYLCTADDHSELLSNTETLDAVRDILDDRPFATSPLLCPDSMCTAAAATGIGVESAELFPRTTRVSSGDLSPLESVQLDHVIDTSPESTFFVEWNTGTVSMTLEEPGGRTIDPAVADSDPNIEYIDGSSDADPVVGYVVSGPIGGTWSLNIAAGADVNPAGEDYVATTTAEAPIDATLSVLDDLVNVGSTMELYLAVTDSDTSVTGATVTAVASDRCGTETSLDCLDDGIVPDATAGDGTYSCAYGPLATSGNHSVAFQVRGTNSASAAFERAVFSELSVNSDSATLAGTFGEIAIDSDGNGLSETLAIDVDVTVVEAGTYSLSGTLADSADAEIDSKVVSSVVLPAGSAVIRLEFEGFLIREHGVPGPYALSDLWLSRSDEDRALCDAGNDVYMTASYNATDFEIRDPDNDDVASDVDTCPNIPNPLQEDADTDGVGNVCDNCPNNANATQADTDGDTFGDACDLCLPAPDAFQNDADSDGLGDSCDPDSDGDAVGNDADCAVLDATVWAHPSEILDVNWISKSTMTWSPPASPGTTVSPSYDVVKGDLLDLRSTGNFLAAVCFSAHSPSTAVSDPLDPPEATVFYFLVRGRNLCGGGTYGFDSIGERAVTVCP